jgi:hypothetical protein
MDEMVAALAESDQVDQLSRAPFAFVWRNALQEQWKRDVLEHVHRGEEIEKLKDKTDLAAPELSQGRVIRVM